VEMPGLWKAWKAKSRLTTLSTSPWKSRQRRARFPHSHSADDEGDGKVENQKQVSHFPTAPRIYRENQRKAKAGGLRPPPTKDDRTSTKGDLSRQPGRRHFQAHAALESTCRFRLMAYWNQFSISGSFVDWKMLLRNGRGWRHVAVKRHELIGDLQQHECRLGA
jgi:hypothetical protein